MKKKNVWNVLDRVLGMGAFILNTIRKATSAIFSDSMRFLVSHRAMTAGLSHSPILVILRVLWTMYPLIIILVLSVFESDQHCVTSRLVVSQPCGQLELFTWLIFQWWVLQETNSTKKT